MNNYGEYLEWDSNFFGFNVFKLNHEIITEEDFIKLSGFIKNKKLKLCYYSSKRKFNFSFVQNLNLEFKLVSQNITYSKAINISELELKKSLIESYKDLFVDCDLIKLAIQSGNYSRFNKDERIGTEKFAELYKLWIVNSVSRKIAEEVLVYREKEKIVGVITLVLKNGFGNIGLIAVDLNYRGLGIGKSLMNSAELWFHNRGCNFLKVSTQKENILACKFYEQIGFKAEEEKYFYHFWIKD